MLSNIQKLIRLSVVLLTMWALLFGFLCIGMFYERSMHMDMSNTQTVLSMTSGESCCGTTMSQHIESWKNTFLALPYVVRDSLILLTLGLTLILAYSWLSFRDRYSTPDPDVGLLRLYIRQNPNIVIFNNLKLAFARGILNPKLY